MSKIINIPTYNAVTLNTANKYCEEDITITLDPTLIPSGTIDITSNGIHDVSNYANANVNVVSEEENLLVDFLSNSVTNLTKEDLQGATGIRNYAFYTDQNIVSVEMPDTVTTIGQRGFSNCPNLTNVTLSKNLVSIGGYCFMGSANLTNIVLPDTLVTLEGYSFSGCKNLTEIIIPDSVKGVLSNMFTGCTSLVKAVIGNGVGANMGQGAFSGCTALKDITLGTSVTFLNDGCFSGCTSLETIALHENVERFGANAFYNCTALKSIKILSPTVPTLNNINAFGNTMIANGAGYFYVQDDLVDSYKTATNWVTYAEQIKPLSELEG